MSNDDPFPLQSEKKRRTRAVKIFHHYTNLLVPNDLNFPNDEKTHVEERFKINKTPIKLHVTEKGEQKKYENLPGDNGKNEEIKQSKLKITTENGSNNWGE